MTWRSIKDDPPPKDGTLFLGYQARIATPKNPCVMAVCRWDVGGGVSTVEMFWGPMPNGLVMVEPTHWMPLPEPPDA